jgi:homoserine kinase
LENVMKERKWIEVFAPATVANLGPGYDVLGLALTHPGDIVRARKNKAFRGVRMLRISGDHAFLPSDRRNTACVAAERVLEQLSPKDGGIELELHKGLPIGSGLGSSGASAVAAAVAVNALFDNSLTRSELVEPCARAEEAACGASHADNVAPALLGGITLVRSADDVSQIQCSLPLALALVSPLQELPTREARQVIPPQIPLSEVVKNSALVASLTYALAMSDLSLIRRSLVDPIAEPRRAHLIPGFADVKNAAIEAGALGSSISGAGPTIFALCETIASAREVEQAMAAALTAQAIPFTSNVSPISRQGARIVS